MDSKTLKEYIYQNDLVENVLESLNIHSIRNHGHYITCGFPDGDNPSALTIKVIPYLAIKSYTRPIVNPRGFQTDIVDLVCFVKKLEPFKALLYLSEVCGLNTSIGKEKTIHVDDGLDVFRKHRKKKLKEQEIKSYPLSVLNKYSKVLPISIVQDDWILPDMWEKYHLRFDEEGERILFPHLDWKDETRILAIVGRTTRKAWQELKIAKYLTVLGVGYNKGANLYGLSINRSEIEKERKIIIYESEKSVIKSDILGYPFGVSVGCHSLTKEQIKIILSLPIDEVIFAFDKDVPVEEYMLEMNYLKSFRKVSYIVDNEQFGLLGPKDSPVDKGLKRFRYLYKHRKEV